MPQILKNEPKGLDGIFGSTRFVERGIEGKLKPCVRYAREHNLPFWEFVWECKWLLLNLQEIFWSWMGPTVPKWTSTLHIRVIDLMEDQKAHHQQRRDHAFGIVEVWLKARKHQGKPMAKRALWSVIATGMNTIMLYRQQLEAAGLIATGTNPETGLVEIGRFLTPLVRGSTIPSRIQKHWPTHPLFRDSLQPLTNMLKNSDNLSHLWFWQDYCTLRE